jgi:hypothetical protein
VRSGLCVHDGVGLASSDEGRGPVQGGVDRAPRAVRCPVAHIGGGVMPAPSTDGIERTFALP